MGTENKNIKKKKKYFYVLFLIYTNMTSQRTRHTSRWSLDFSTKTRGTEQPASPPSFSASNVALHAEANRQSDPSLKAKRSWDLALGPIKQVLGNGFMMYMSGSTISIIPITMVITMA